MTGPSWPVERGTIVRAAVTLEKAARRYDFLSPVYDLNAILGSSVSREAIRIAAIREGEFVLELGVGTGRDLARLARCAGRTGVVCGLDLAAGMLLRARRRVQASGHGARVMLPRGDARRIPIADDTMDVVFSSRLLDLVDTPEILPILGECRRVLKPSGRVVLVNMSKPGGERTLFERLYLSEIGFRGLLFLSRPVLAAPFLEELDFERVTRVYRRGFPLGSEIVSGRKKEIP